MIRTPVSAVLAITLVLVSDQCATDPTKDRTSRGTFTRVPTQRAQSESSERANRST